MMRWPHTHTVPAALDGAAVLRHIVAHECGSRVDVRDIDVVAAHAVAVCSNHCGLLENAAFAQEVTNR